jgi:hypothetical protein
VDTSPYVVIEPDRWTVYVLANGMWAPYKGGEDMSEPDARALAEKLRARGMQVRVETTPPTV